VFVAITGEEIGLLFRSLLVLQDFMLI